MAKKKTEETPVQAVGEVVGQLPDYVDRLLSKYPEHSELYIDPYGGAYTRDAQPDVRRGAILYKNPYHKL